MNTSLSKGLHTRKYIIQEDRHTVYPLIMFKINKQEANAFSTTNIDVVLLFEKIGDAPVKGQVVCLLSYFYVKNRLENSLGENGYGKLENNNNCTTNSTAVDLCHNSNIQAFWYLE